MAGMDFSFLALCFPTLPWLQDTPGKNSHPTSLPGAVGKGVLEPPIHFVPEKKRIWEQLPQFQVHWAPSELWLINHCRVLAGITGVNKEHFCVQVWLSWKWDLLSKTIQPLLPFTWEIWGVDIDISHGLELMNTLTAAITTPKYPQTEGQFCTPSAAPHWWDTHNPSSNQLSS